MEKRILELIICFYLFAFICNNINAQQIDTVFHKVGLIIKINPLQLAAQEVRLEMEKPLKKNNTLELTTSYIYSNYVVSIFSSYRVKGGKIGGAFKHYFLNYELGSTYFNTSFFYKYYSLKDITDIIDNVSLGIKTKSIYYHVISLQLQYGTCHVWSDWDVIVLDYYFGIGIRYKYGVAIQESTIPEVIIPEHRVLEAWFYPTINIGCTVGYRFVKKNKRNTLLF